MIRIRDFWQLLRPFTMLAPLVGIVSGAMLAAGHSGTAGWEVIEKSWAAVATGMLAALLLNGASNILNQVTDLKIDRRNKPDRPLPRGGVSVKSAIVASVLLYLAALLVASGIRSDETHAPLLIVFGGALLTLAYSVPPVRTKRHGTLANLTIALARGMLLPICGWSCVADLDRVEPWAIGTILGLFIFGAASTKDFSDEKGDAEGGCQTWVVAYGPQRTAQIIAPFLMAPWLLLAIAWCLPESIAFLPGADLRWGVPLALFLAGYGWWIGRLLKRSSTIDSGENYHAAWKHIYLQYLTALLGLPWVYLSQSG